MKFCSNCGESVVLRIPEGDNRERFVCDNCHTIHYQNPNIVAGCIPEWEGRILLCKRAIEPRYGLWTLPAGFMENGETTEQAAMRETHEEAGANVEITSLYGLFSIPHISQVYMLYHGFLVNGAYEAGCESLECRLFNEQDIPWDKLAFPVVRETLQRFFADRKHGKDLPLQRGEIIKHPKRES
ncbi:ADP-ribose pyrophosphatase YjhB (NUDIX family) [Thiogranum longum]|uniref:ADP-ribose pyrophosphatase YjhB (NUDIX family) n=1 Tax=Thiogranum longum TaxID=1537524 RepID=A0A4R1HCJ9_9GAMM|nr:NUDIX hydrolase [Thiogranum longum]TCK19178.1 ADP-ribose pyrophosphatase YjhB (NUDIX family) [Thiogranum longum]